MKVTRSGNHSELSISEMSSSSTAAAVSAANAAGPPNLDPNTLRFRRPRPSSSASAPAGAGNGREGYIFPPTVFTDAKYTRGILVPNSTITDNSAVNNNDNGRILEDVAIQIPADYFDLEGGRPRQLPALSRDEAARWNDTFAAQAAARRRCPMEAVRLLGTITLPFEEKVSKN